MRNIYKFFYLLCIFTSCSPFGNETYNSSAWLDFSYEKDDWEVKVKSRQRQLRYVLNYMLKPSMDTTCVQKILGKGFTSDDLKKKFKDFMEHEYHAYKFNEKDLDTLKFSHLEYDLGPCRYGAWFPDGGEAGFDYLILQFDTSGKYTGVFAVGHHSLW
jgi:hypothetical protein